ncbi:MAG: flagellar biosynthetic protein FliR [Magnetovibrionaceae bacterium]
MLEAYVALSVWKFMLIFARLGAAFGLMPGFSAPYVNVQMRLATALVISLAAYPLLSPMIPERPPTIGLAIMLLGGEMLIGIFMGLVPRVLVGAVQVAGTVISFVSSLANAFIQDPLAEQQSSIIAGFMSTLALLLIFVTDTHHLMIMAIIQSYDLFVPGQAIMVEDMTHLMARRVAEIFALGVQMASPLIVVGLTYYIGLGLLGRLMPALPVFFVAMPIQLALQATVFMVTLSSMMLVFMAFFEEKLRAFMVL